MPRGSLQIGLPCFEKYASSRVRTADASIASCKPSSINSRTACGSTLMPTPSGFNSDTLSNTFAGTPIWCRLSASVSPPMPPPAMSTVMTKPLQVRASWHRRADVGNCEENGVLWTSAPTAVIFQLSHEVRHAQALLRHRHLRTRHLHHPGRGRRRLHGRAAELQGQSAEQPGLSRHQSEGPRAGAGDRPRCPDRDAGDAGLSRADL